MKKTLFILLSLFLIVGCEKDQRIETSWYENGQKMSEITYKYGKQDGLWTEWYENGQKEGEGTYKYVNNYRDPEREGKWTEWFENGKKKYEETYKDGNIISVKKWNRGGGEEE